MMLKRVIRAFSLIELMIVIAILGIVAAIAVPAYSDYIIRAKVSGMTTIVNELKQVLTEYRTTVGNFKSLKVDYPEGIWKKLGMENPIVLTDASQGGTVEGVTNEGAVTKVMLASSDNKHIAIAVCGHSSNLGLIEDNERVNLFYGGTYSSSGIRWSCMYEGTMKYVPTSCRTEYDPLVFGELPEPCPSE